MQRLRGKLSYSNVVSTLCLVLLLGGGTAYAATQMLPKDSVGTRQLKNAAVTPAKLSRAAKKMLTGAPGTQGPKGDRGEPGPPGPQGVPGLTGDAPLIVDLTGGEVPGMNRTTASSVPLTGVSSWTATAGQAGLLFGKVTATLAYATGGFLPSCSVQVTVFDNGRAVANVLLASGEATLTETSANLQPVVIAIDEPGVHTIGATATGDTECQAGSKIDSVHLMVAPLG